ncbi:transferase 2, rSAM/selenodomain-associated [Desulfonatronum thiosulfatophilum]|uniref:Transferase 2, rSAM/selenodomain-associated n=1 Tax=Desulfonatronum thiosulfatophilum TaxID=617002 RepID=A0A1G6C247_9BACT|nr:TIGR04283 family arsenosugar biosynthesis glycosyltransferase [Desulfonatronum thiosulfatophilum]SDB26934.1 transferase 2, rSAM/selenodomain-associated [Desulfonatronum thiosulfatophilum]
MNIPWLSIIIPVFREERQIRLLLEQLEAQDGVQDWEILIADGDPERRTSAAVDDPDIVLVASDLGRARQMNAGAQRSRGEVLLFLHADTRLPPHVGRMIRRALANPAVVGGAFSLEIAPAGFGLRLIAAAANLRTRWTGVPYGDQAVFMRREPFEALGGYPDIPLMEDLELMRRIRQKSWRITLLAATVQTSGRRWAEEGVLWCSLRNWTIRLLYRFGVSPERLKRFYRTRGAP